MEVAIIFVVYIKTNNQLARSPFRISGGLSAFIIAHGVLTKAIKSASDELMIFKKDHCKSCKLVVA